MPSKLFILLSISNDLSEHLVDVFVGDLVEKRMHLLVAINPFLLRVHVPERAARRVFLLPHVNITLGHGERPFGLVLLEFVLSILVVRVSVVMHQRFVNDLQRENKYSYLNHEGGDSFFVSLDQLVSLPY